MTTQPTPEAGADLPEFDPTLHKGVQGVYRKFEVRRTDGSDAPGGKHEGCEYFVLDTTDDPHAKAALAAYADSCAATHPVLADDIRIRYRLRTQATGAGGDATFTALHNRCVELNQENDRLLRIIGAATAPITPDYRITDSWTLSDPRDGSACMLLRKEPTNNTQPLYAAPRAAVNPAATDAKVSEIRDQIKEYAWAMEHNASAKSRGPDRQTLRGWHRALTAALAAPPTDRAGG